MTVRPQQSGPPARVAVSVNAKPVCSKPRRDCSSSTSLDHAEHHHMADSNRDFQRQASLPPGQRPSRFYPLSPWKPVHPATSAHVQGIRGTNGSKALSKASSLSRKIEVWRCYRTKITLNEIITKTNPAVVA